MQVCVASCLVLTAAGVVHTHRLATLAHVVVSRRRALGVLAARVTREPRACPERLERLLRGPVGRGPV